MGLGLEIIIVVGMLIVLVALIGYIVSIYNGLIRLKHNIKKSWANIEVLLKQRSDELPKLINSVKGYMKHERETLENITQARSQAMGAGSVGEKAKAEKALSGAMSNFFLVVENYPDLKANQNFLAIQEELTSTENKIAFSRQSYNDQVLFFNNKIQMFPSNIIAGMFNFKIEEFFELETEAEKAVPKVDFS